MNTVYIIESPNDQDLLSGRREGEALSKALSLVGVRVLYFLATTKNAVILAFKDIKKDVLSSKSRQTELPYIHLSAHGNKSGFALTNLEFIDWDLFEKILLELNNELGYVSLPNKKIISKLVLCMSVCEGLHISKILKAKPFQAVIGNKSPILWGEALTAFIVFYYNAISKQHPFDVAVKKMNYASSSKVAFEIEIDYEI